MSLTYGKAYLELNNIAMLKLMDYEVIPRMRGWSIVREGIDYFKTSLDELVDYAISQTPWAQAAIAMSPEGDNGE